jgi:hypothetical protein
MATLIQYLQEVLLSGDPTLPNETKRILLKEALQVIVLDYLYNHPRYRGLRFYGGSCLRVVYGLNRLSEDLDLDNQHKIDLGCLNEDLSGYFSQRLNYSDITTKEQTGRTGILRLTLKFPILQALALSPLQEEALHLKLEISHHPQIAEISHTPVFYHGRSLVPAHFSIETMMAAKMLACLERSFQAGKTTTVVKGRDFYDLLWLMGIQVQPLKEKLAQDGKQPYTTKSAMLAIQERVDQIRPRDLAIDLLSLFEQRVFIESWIDSFYDNFKELMIPYLESDR